MTTKHAIRLLGSFALRDVRGQEHRLSTRKAELLIAHLAMAKGQPQTREHLGALLWPDVEPGRARANLRQSLLTVRQTLGTFGAEWLRVDARHLTIDLTLVSVDALALEHLSSSSARAELARLRDDYTGEFLHGADSQSPRLSTWLERERARLDQCRVDALERLLELDSGAQAWSEVLPTARALLAIDAAHEKAACGLAEARVRRGDRGLAIRGLNDFTDRLRTRFEIAPGEATLACLERLRAGSGTLPSSPIPEPQIAPVAQELRRLCVMILRDAETSEVFARARAQAAHVERIHDGLLLVFGRDETIGDEASRAVRLAHDLFASGTTEKVATGLDVVEATAVPGNSARIPRLGPCARAIQLASLAASGEVLIDRRLKGSLPESEFGFTPGPIEGSWRCTRTSRPEALTHFVGRSFEVGQLLQALHWVQDHGAGVIACIRGDAGIGKSRLTLEIEDRARDLGFKSMRVGLSEGYFAGAARLEHALARELVEHEGDDQGLDAVERAHLDELLERKKNAAANPLLASIDPQARRDLGREVLRKLLFEVLAQALLIVRFDDVHLATRDDRDLLFWVLETARGKPLLALLAMRNVDDVELPFSGVMSGGRTINFDLGPLDPAESEDLACQFDLDAALRLSCRERAAGNPLFLEQLLIHMREAPSDACPPTIQAVVLSRLDQLAPRARAALRLAAVFGGAAPRAGLHALAAVTRNVIDDLIDRGLLTADGDDLKFTHGLVRDAIYSSIPPNDRRQLHRQLAQWHRDRDPAGLARHLGWAEDPKAGGAFLDAARAKFALSQFGEAEDLARHGLDHARDAFVRYGLAMVRGAALRELGRNVEALEGFELAQTVATEPNDRARALLGRASSRRNLDQIDDGLDDLEQAETLLGRGHLKEDRAELALSRGRLLFARGDVGGTERAYRECLRHAAELGHAAIQAEALGGLADAHYAQGQFQSALAFVSQSADIAHANGLERIRVAQRSLQVHLLAYTGRQNAARDEAYTAVRECHDAHHWRAEINALLGVVATSFSMRDLTACSAALETVKVLIKRFEAKRFLVVSSLYEARLALLQGDVPEARHVLDKALEIAERTGFAVYGAQIFGLLAIIETDGSSRDQLLEIGEARLAQGSVAHNHIRFRLNAALAEILADRPERARACLAKVGDFMSRERSAWVEAHAEAHNRLIGAVEERSNRSSWHDFERKVQALDLSGLAALSQSMACGATLEPQELAARTLV